MKRIIKLVGVLLLATHMSHGQALLIINAKIHTVTEGDNNTATAILSQDGKITAIGDNEALLKAYAAAVAKNKQLIDLKNSGVVYPGLIDAHCHFTGYALDAYKCNLFDTKSAADMISQLKAYADTTKMPYLYGHGWDQNTWAVKEFPDKAELDKLFPNRIVVLKRVDGHAILVNQYALDTAGINAITIVDGGQIIKSNGQLTGILIDKAMDKIESLIPAASEKQSIAWLKQMELACLKDGLTYVVDCGLPAPQISLLGGLYRKNKLSIGITALLSSDSATLLPYINAGPFKIGQLSVSGIKVYADGALGSRGACLLSPYSDDRRNYGTMLIERVPLIRLAYEAKKYNWQLCTHAIGDSANRTVLKAYDQVLEPNNNNRWRIEHAQIVDPHDYSIFKNKAIVPSVQPTHAVSDMNWVGSRLGPDRIHHAYSYKALLDAAGTIALGTDFPVEGINPLATFYTAVSRKDSIGNPIGGFNPEGKLSRMETLKGMTIWAAKSVFMEAWKGSIEVDKDADFTILDADLLQCAEADILKAKVLYTIIGGKVVYKKKD